MQETSAVYKDIIASPNHYFESSLVIGESGRLMNERAYIITFGGTSILVSRGGGDSGYQENRLLSMSTSNQVFSGDTPMVGCAVSGEIDVVMMKPLVEIPRMAQLVPYVRVTDGTRYSEWIPKGVYYIDTREFSDSGAGQQTLTMHGFDNMLKADADFDLDRIDFPATDIAVVCSIAEQMGVELDSRTIAKMNKGYLIPLPSGYTMREILGNIASMYVGNFIFNDEGALRLVSLNELPAETRYLVTNAAEIITFGGDRILV